MNPPATTITFLGTCANLPYIGEDCSSLVINGKYMLDTGWYGAVRMLSHGLDPVRLKYLFITHRHNDHTLGLPQLLLYRRIKRIQEGLQFPPLKIVGPEADLPGIIQRAVAILQWPDGAILPEAIPLRPGENLDTEGFTLETCASNHTAHGLVYRFTDKKSGCQLAFSGDTMYDENIVAHVDGVSLLVHEACYNDGDPPDKPGKHSQPKQAALAARKAGVGKLALIHATPHFRREKVEAAREIFPNTFWPRDGETISVEPAKSHFGNRKETNPWNTEQENP